MKDDASNNPASNRDQRELVDAAWKQIEIARRGLTSATAAMAAQPLPLRGTSALAEGLPGYKIIREIHRGGQGVVYEAIQESTNRTVAVKMMRTGPFAGPHDRMRFEREVQILARLRHPNIVTVHDSGSFEEAAYFVMDYIEGEHLDHFVRDHNLTLNDRLRLFARVCAAVHVAHLRGVIHRDLKPSNIRIDAEGEPHILDFGLAKHEELDRPAGTVGDTITMTGQFVGSLPWASPEQADGRQDGLDVRTDVYSLGVMLFQLLTGKFPYNVSGSIRQTAEAIARTQPTRPQSLNREVDEELATIVLKALQKEPALRYQTAGELGRDIERYLNGEAIEAKRDSATYIIRKHLARHKATAGVVFAFLLIITFGFVVALSLWRQTEAARRAEADQRRIAEEHRQLAETRADEAAAEAAKATAVTNFLAEMLKSASPVEGVGAKVTVAEVIDSAARRLDADELQNQPMVQATLRRVIGNTYAGLGEFEKGLSYLEAGCAAQSKLDEISLKDRVSCQVEQAAILRTQGDLDAAEALFQDSLEQARSNPEAVGPVLVDCMNGLAKLKRDRDQFKEAEALHREALSTLDQWNDAQVERRAQTYNDLSLILSANGDVEGAIDAAEQSLALWESAFGRRHHNTAVAISNLSEHIAEAGKFAEADKLHVEALEIFREVDGERHPVVASCLDSLGRLHAQRGHYKVSVQYFEEALSIRREVFGERHAMVAHTINNLAVTRYRLGDLDGAAGDFRTSIEIMRETRGPNHPSIFTLMTNLAAILNQKGDVEGSADVLRDALARQREAFGDEHPRVALTKNNLGKSLLDMGRLDEAEMMLRDALDTRIKIYGESHAEVASTQDLLGGVLRKKKELEEAEYMFRAALKTRREILGDGHLDVALTLNNLAGLFSDRGDYESAEPFYAEAVVVAEKNLPAEHWQVAQIRGNWGGALVKIGQYDRAESVLLSSYKLLEAMFSASDPRAVAVSNNLVKLYDAWNRPDEAEAWRKAGSSPAAESQPAAN